MFSVLVVDDDRTCLLLLKAYLERWNYEVTIVNNGQDALNMLRIRSYDLVLSDVHMPDMNGLELLQQIDQEFHLPVILMSADRRAEVMCMGVKNGAQRFLVKPIEADDLKDIWQYSVWWKATKNITQINESSEAGVEMADHHNGKDNNINVEEEGSSPTIGAAGDDTMGRRNEKIVWTTDLHNRFVEAMLIIGYQNAVPTNILEIMNIPGLTRGQVASHWQKFQRFLKGVLSGTTNIEFSNWIDLDYYSRVVSGNPNLLLINQLREDQRNGNLGTDNPLRPLRQPNINCNVRAPNGSLSIGRYRPLPQSTIADSWGLDNATLKNAYNGNMGSINGSGTSNLIHNTGFGTNQMGFYDQNTLLQEQNHSRNGGLVGGTTNNMIPSSSNVAPCSNAPLYNNFYSQQSLNMGGQGSNSFYNEYNLNPDQGTKLGNSQGDQSIGISNHGNHSGNISATSNTTKYHGEQMTDGIMFNNNPGNYFDYTL